MVIVSHAFKKRRFLELHLPALRFPVERCEFIGIDPCFSSDSDGGQRRLQEIGAGDLKRGYGAWKEDLYGARALLVRKKTERGWNERRERQLGEAIAAGEVSSEAMLLIEKLWSWVGGDSGKEIFAEPLPWEN